MLEPFFPNELLRHLIVSCFLIILEMVAIMVFPLPWKIFNKPDHIPWFLLPLYQLRTLIQNEAVFISAVVLSALLFIAWPFLVCDRKYRMSSLRNAEDRNSNHARHGKGRHNLWHQPVLFTIVIFTIIFLITLCFIKT